YPHNARGLGIGEAMHKGQQQDFAVDRRELPQRRDNLITGYAGKQGRLRLQIGRRHVQQLSRLGSRRLHSTQALACPTTSDTKEPGPHTGLTPITVGILPDRNQRILQQLLGSSPIAGEVVEVVKERPAVAQVEIRQSLTIAKSYSCYQL